MRIVSGEARGIGPSIARAALFAASGFYFLGYQAKRTAFDAGLLHQVRVDARVISIGNIVAGGTGKTPAVIHFARRFTNDGKKVAVLSRGYGRITPIDEPLAVSDFTKTRLSPRESGDEPYLIAEKLPGIPVVVCGNRVKGAHFTIERFQPDIILLDDGFQHRALARDEDIVTIDCSNPFGFGHLLPRGLLREPLSALARATCFLVTHADERDCTHAVAILRTVNPTARILKSAHRPVWLVRLNDGTKHVCDMLAGKKVLAFSGIGNPASFEQTLRRIGANIVRAIVFKDHHWYDAADMDRINEEAKRSGAEFMVTTAKDAVRLPAETRMSENLLGLEIEIELLEGNRECEQ